MVVTSVPFRLRMLSMVIVSSHRVAWPAISSRPGNWGHVMEPVLFHEEHQHIISAESSQRASGKAQPIGRWQTGA
jgi:hypothetical protein